jgi:hypothetical protein
VVIRVVHEDDVDVVEPELLEALFERAQRRVVREVEVVDEGRRPLPHRLAGPEEPSDLRRDRELRARLATSAAPSLRSASPAP